MAGPTTEGRKLSRSFGGLALLGALLAVAGLVGLVYTGVATLTSMILFGWLLLVGGLVGLLHAVQARGTAYFWLGVVVAALNIAAGVVVLKHPEGTAETLTMFAALLFLTGGVFRLVGSVVVRGPAVRLDPAARSLRAAAGPAGALRLAAQQPLRARLLLLPGPAVRRARADRDRRGRTTGRQSGDGRR